MKVNIRLEHVSEFKYFGCVLDESGTDVAECSRRRVAGAIRSLVTARSLQLECARVFHDSLLVPVLTYGSEIMIWREKQMDNPRGLLGIRRMDEVPNARIRELCGVTKSGTKRLVKVFPDGSTMRREWRLTRLLRGSM